MNKLISIIVPVYNTRQYLDKCVESIVKQTYDNIEVLLIDDGSTDGSDKLCDKWLKKDNRIKVYHKRNGGLSDARNFGLEHATGEYIGFVDSDDWVDRKMYEVLLNGCERHNVDVGCCNRIRVFARSTKKEVAIKENGCVDKTDALVFLLEHFDPSACNKIFKKKLFSGIQFPYGKLYEDIGTVPYVISRANGMYLDSIFGYYYNLTNEKSIVHEKFNIRKMDYYEHLKKLHGYLAKEYPELGALSDYYYALSLTAIITDVYTQRKKYSKEYKLLIDELQGIGYIKNEFIPKSKKIMIFLDLHYFGWVVNMLKKITRGHK